MLKIERFVNELMNSNCYVVYDEDTKRCLVIDPGSEKSLREIEFVEKNNLTFDYIVITHEHTDHNWGVNALVAKYPEAKVICSEACKQNLKKEVRAYFLLYYNNLDYHYRVCDIDLTTEDIGWNLEWIGYNVKFIPAPGHSMGSICIEINGRLFTGDAILQSKPHINKRNGSIELFYETAARLRNSLPPDELIYPGHGDAFPLCEYIVPERSQKIEA